MEVSVATSITIGIIVIWGALALITIAKVYWVNQTDGKQVHHKRRIEAITIYCTIGGSVVLFFFLPSVTDQLIQTSSLPERLVLLMTGSILYMGLLGLIIYAIWKIFELIYTDSTTDNQMPKISFTHQFQFYTAVFAIILLTAGEILLLLNSSDIIPLLIVAFMVFVAWILFTTQVRFYAFADYVRFPTLEEQARINECYQRFGRTPGKVLITGESAQQAGVMVTGNSDTPTVGIKESLFETADEDELAVLLAQQDELNRQHFWQVCIYGLITLISISAFIAHIFFIKPINISNSLTTNAINILSIKDVDLYVVAIIAVFSFVLLKTYEHYLKKCVFQADEFAAKQISSSSVERTYNKLGSDYLFLGMKNTNILVPSITDRIRKVGGGPSFSNES